MKPQRCWALFCCRNRSLTQETPSQQRQAANGYMARGRRLAVIETSPGRLNCDLSLNFSSVISDETRNISKYIPRRFGGSYIPLSTTSFWIFHIRATSANPKSFRIIGMWDCRRPVSRSGSSIPVTIIDTRCDLCGATRKKRDGYYGRAVVWIVYSWWNPQSREPEINLPAPTPQALVVPCVGRWCMHQEPWWSLELWFRCPGTKTRH